MLIARSRLKHQYPHSWRSKKPIIFRNTPQWFIAMDKGIDKRRRYLARARHAGDRATRIGCRRRARTASTAWSSSKPDWVISRQRAWGVPIAVFIKEKPDGSVDILEDPEVERAHRRGLRAGRRRRLVQGRRARALPRAEARQRTVEKGRRHSRRLVRFAAPRTPSCWRTRCIFPRSPASSASATAAKTP